MAKLIILLFALAVSVTCSQAQADPDVSPAVDTEAQATEFSNHVLAVLSRRVVVANLPENLQSAAADVLTNAEAQLKDCEAALAVNHLVWQYKVCATAVLRNGNLQLNALKTAAVVATVAQENQVP